MTEQELNRISYQLDSWKRFRWEPEWFGVKRINLEIFEKVKKFQKEFLHKKCDGLIDYQTYELIYSKKNNKRNNNQKETLSNSIITFNDYVQINSNVIHKCYTQAFLCKNYQVKEQSNIEKIIISFANTYNSNMYEDIMKNKKTICHFVIDANGLITQFADLNIQSNDDTSYDTFNAIVIKLINPLLVDKNKNILDSGMRTTKIEDLFFYDFTEIQLESMMKLINKLTFLFSIPFKINSKGIQIEEHLLFETIAKHFP